MPVVRRLGDLGFSPDVERLHTLVGKTVIISRIARFSSQRYGTGVELVAIIVDPATGVMSPCPERIVTFGKAVLRLADFLLNTAGAESMHLDPPVQCDVELDGNTVVLR